MPASARSRGLCGGGACRAAAAAEHRSSQDHRVGPVVGRLHGGAAARGVLGHVQRASACSPAGPYYCAGAPPQHRPLHVQRAASRWHWSARRSRSATSGADRRRCRTSRIEGLPVLRHARQRRRASPMNALRTLLPATACRPPTSSTCSDVARRARVRHRRLRQPPAARTAPPYIGDCGFDCAGAMLRSSTAR